MEYISLHIFPLIFKSDSPNISSTNISIQHKICLQKRIKIIFVNIKNCTDLINREYQTYQFTLEWIKWYTDSSNCYAKKRCSAYFAGGPPLIRRLIDRSIGCLPATRIFPSFALPRIHRDLSDTAVIARNRARIIAIPRRPSANPPHSADPRSLFTPSCIAVVGRISRPWRLVDR